VGAQLFDECFHAGMGDFGRIPDCGTKFPTVEIVLTDAPKPKNRHLGVVLGAVFTRF